MLLKVDQPLKYFVQGTSVILTALTISLCEVRAHSCALCMHQFINQTFPYRISPPGDRDVKMHQVCESEDTLTLSSLSRRLRFQKGETGVEGR
jgi:hypothetical protein